VNELPNPADFSPASEPIPPPIAPPTLADRYQIERILGTNATGGRVTYLAHPVNPNQTDSKLEPSKVVIKEFQFAQTGSRWQGYDAIAREFEILQAIDHPGIPSYIEQFETDRAIYLVQTYKDAPTLAQRITAPDPTINLATARQIAIDLLEILVYLQSRTPPILHRDLKPENILLSDRGEIFLVDFGFAQRGVSGTGEGTASSLVRGTMGFMAPEQILNRPLTTATDLYGLGATLVCWLTGTPSDRVGDWIGAGFRLEVDRAVPQLPLPARQWLAKLVATEAGDRFDSARSALEALRLISFESVLEPVLEPEGDISDTSVTMPIPSISIQATAQSLQELQRSWNVLPMRRLVILAIASGAFICGVDWWWSLSVSAGQAINVAIRSLLLTGLTQWVLEVRLLTLF
jgi:serine/threonine protein kinase